MTDSTGTGSGNQPGDHRGDAGRIAIGGHGDVLKNDVRAVAVAESDAANAAVAVAMAGGGLPADILSMLLSAQNDLFDLGADLATPGEDFAPSEMVLRVVPAQVERLERAIDGLNAHLPPLTSFVLPGGSAGSAALHLARAITRRAERSAVAMGAAANPEALRYLNRLSDYLFVAARAANGAAGDVLWKPGATR